MLKCHISSETLLTAVTRIHSSSTTLVTLSLFTYALINYSRLRFPFSSTQNRIKSLEFCHWYLIKTRKKIVWQTEICSIVSFELHYPIESTVTFFNFFLCKKCSLFRRHECKRGRKFPLLFSCIKVTSLRLMIFSIA